MTNKMYRGGLKSPLLEPIVREPDVALSMTAFGSLANRKILPDIPSKLTASLAMLSTFAYLKAMLY